MFDTFDELGAGLLIATVAIFLLLQLISSHLNINSFFNSYPAVLIGAALILILTGTL